MVHFVILLKFIVIYMIETLYENDTLLFRNMTMLVHFGILSTLFCTLKSLMKHELVKISAWSSENYVSSSNSLNVLKNCSEWNDTVE